MGETKITALKLIGQVLNSPLPCPDENIHLIRRSLEREIVHSRMGLGYPERK